MIKSAVDCTVAECTALVNVNFVLLQAAIRIYLYYCYILVILNNSTLIYIKVCLKEVLLVIDLSVNHSFFGLFGSRETILCIE